MYFVSVSSNNSGHTAARVLMSLAFADECVWTSNIKQFFLKKSVTRGVHSVTTAHMKVYGTGSSILPEGSTCGTA